MKATAAAVIVLNHGRRLARHATVAELLALEFHRQDFVLVAQKRLPAALVKHNAVGVRLQRGVVP